MTDWMSVKKKTSQLIEKRCRRFHEVQKQALLSDDGGRLFFKQTKNYLSKQRPKPFDVMDMDLFADHCERYAVEHLAGHFNAISSEFSPLSMADIPQTHSKPIKLLEPYQVALRLKKFKKPKSMVRGDIFPDLVTRYADLLAIPIDLYIQ